MATADPVSHLADRERRIFVNHIVNLKNALATKRVATTNGQPSEDVMVTVHMLEDEVLTLKARVEALESGSAAPATTPRTQVDRLRDLLADSDWMSAADIAHAFDCTANTVWRLLSRMSEGEVEKRRDGALMVYRLTRLTGK